MFAMNWTAESQVIAPSWLTHIAGVVGSLQAGRPKVLMAARLAFATQVMFVIGSKTVCLSGLTWSPLPVAGGVPGILPWIMGSRYRKLGSVLAPCQPVANEKVALPWFWPA